MGGGDNPQMYHRLFRLLSLAVLLAACSPALNWREVRPGGAELKALLPCKPDQGHRRQRLAGQDIDISMVGCEAGGALFAISVAELGDPDRALAVQVQWQAHLLGNMQAVVSTNSAYAIKGAGAQLAPVRLSARGLRPDGRPVVVQGVWFARGTRLYHAVIYADTIVDAQSEPFFGGLELQ
jgi:hypothetical protein